MKRNRLVAIVVALMAIAGAGLTWQFSLSEPSTWPELLKAKEGEPSYNWELEPDFGWRTGNHVPVTLYFQTGETNKIVPEQLAVEGDFILVDKKTSQEVGPEGEHRTRIDLTLQTFDYKPIWTAQVSIGYNTDSGVIARQKLLPIEIASSKTFDGKNSGHPKEPQLDIIDDGHAWATFALVLIGGVGTVLSVRQLVGRPKEKKAPDAVVEEPLEGIDAIRAAWCAITSGDHEAENYRRLSTQVRDHFGVGTMTVSEIEASEIAHKDVAAGVLSACDRVLWMGMSLDSADVDKVNALLGVDSAQAD